MRVLIIAFSLFILPSSHLYAEPGVGLLTELSGSFAANGADCRKGYEVAVKQSSVEGYSFKAHFGDSKGEAKAAISEMQRLVEVEKVVAVVVNRSQVGMALGPISDRTGVPLIGVIGHSDFVSRYPNVYRAWPDAKAEGQALAQTVWGQGHRSVAAVTLDDEYLVSLTDNFVRSYKKLGGSVLQTVEVMPTESDLRTAALLIARSNPDALLVNLGIPQLGPMYRVLKELQISLPTYSNYWLQTGEVLESARGAADGAIFVEASLDVPKFNQLLSEFQGGSSNLMMTYTCYVAARLALVSASDSLAKTRESLFNKKVLKTPDGELAIFDREVQFELIAKQIEAGEVRPLEVE